MGPKHQLLNHFKRPQPLAAGGAMVVDARGCVSLCIIAGTGATVTYSRVDSMDATVHDGETDTVAATTRETVPVDWPFFRVSVADGSARVAVV